MIECPHCHRSLGDRAREGGYRVRLSIVVVDPDTGTVHGPCPRCKGDVVIAEGASLPAGLVKAVPGPPPPRRARRRRLVLLQATNNG